MHPPVSPRRVLCHEAQPEGADRTDGACPSPPSRPRRLRVAAEHLDTGPRRTKIVLACQNTLTSTDVFRQVHRPIASIGHTSHQRDYRGQPGTTADSFPRPATNHDHGFTGPGKDRRTKRRSPYGRSCQRGVVIVHAGGSRASTLSIADGRRVASRSDDSSHERPAQPRSPKVRSIRMESSGPSNTEQTMKIDRNPGVNRTRVRAKKRVTRPQTHQCRQIQKASYAGLLLRRADRI